MPAVTPAEPHNPELYGSSARQLRGPQPARSTSSRRRPSCGASRQACHAGGHAGRATQSRTVREFQRLRPARLRSTSTQACRRPVEQAARLAMTGFSVEHAARLAMPAVTPAEPHNPELYGSSNANRRQDWPWPARLRAPPPAAEPCRGRPSCPPPPYLRVLCALCGLVFSVSSVVCFLRVLCGLPSPCSFSVSLLFPCPPHPQSQPSPNLFPFPFQPLPNSPFLLLLLPSCMLKVKGAADALVGARTADGASPGQRRRRLQPLPSPDGGELRSLKPAAGGEQAGGGLLT
jgi:hypothetical protein